MWHALIKFATIFWIFIIPSAALFWQMKKVSNVIWRKSWILIVWIYPQTWKKKRKEKKDKERRRWKQSYKLYPTKTDDIFFETLRRRKDLWKPMIFSKDIHTRNLRSRTYTRICICIHTLYIRITSTDHGTVTFNTCRMGFPWLRFFKSKFDTGWFFRDGNYFK